MSLIYACSCGLLAQIPAQLAESTSVGPVQSVWDFLVKGGVLMIPIGICSLIALAVIVERLVSLRRHKVIPPDFLSGLRAALGKGAPDRQAAHKYCEQSATPIANVLAPVVRRLGEPRAVLERLIEQAGEREVFQLRKYLRTLSVIVAVAPMLGLLGTVFGMIQAFQTVAASAEALGRTELLAQGIYEALVTTASGLLVAIPALIGYHWISARIERLVAQMDSLAVEFIETHVENRDALSPPAEPRIAKSVGDAEALGDDGDGVPAEAAAAT